MRLLARTPLIGDYTDSRARPSGGGAAKPSSFLLVGSSLAAINSVVDPVARLLPSTPRFTLAVSLLVPLGLIGLTIHAIVARSVALGGMPPPEYLFERHAWSYSLPQPTRLLAKILFPLSIALLLYDARRVPLPTWRPFSIAGYACRRDHRPFDSGEISVVDALGEPGARDAIAPDGFFKLAISKWMPRPARLTIECERAGRRELDVGQSAPAGRGCSAAEPVEPGVHPDARGSWVFPCP